MSKTPKSSSSAGDDRNLVSVDENYIAPTFEDSLRLFWAKNSRAVITVVVIALAAIVGKGAYGLYAAQREQSIAADYGAAKAGGKLESFIAANGNHILAGVAQLELADKAYAAGNFADARPAYQKAAGILKNDTLGQRARLGAAVSAVQAGSAAEGQSALKDIVANTAADKTVRSEAAYQLASIAAKSGDVAEAIRLIEQSTSIDPEGQWADRASFLRSTLPAPAQTAEKPAEGATPAVSFK